MYWGNWKQADGGYQFYKLSEEARKRSKALHHIKYAAGSLMLVGYVGCMYGTPYMSEPFSAGE